MKNIIIYTLIALISLQFSYSQNFFKSYGIVSENYEQGRRILNASDTTFYIIGLNSYFAHIDSLGNVIWQKKLAVIEDYQFILTFDAINSENESLVLASTVFSSNGNKTNILISQISKTGDIIWQKSFGNPLNYSKATKIIHTQDNGYVIVGKAHEGHGTNFNISFLKINQNGEFVSSKIFAKTDFEEATSVTEAENGDYLITGYTGNPGNMFLIRTNNVGDTIWTKEINGHLNEAINDIIAIPGDKYIMTGYTSNKDYEYHHDYDLFICCINGNGSIDWVKTYGSVNNERGFGAYLNTDNEVLVTGYSTSTGQEDIYIIKTNLSGDTLFTKSFGGSSFDIGYNLTQNSHGYKIIGETRSFSIELEDICMLSFDENFSNICREQYFETNIVTSTWWTSFQPGFQEKSGINIDNRQISIQNPTIQIQDDCDCVPPIANYVTYETDGWVEFQDYSTWAYSWYWDFGDGETSILQNPGHLILTDLNVCLTVTNECGTDTHCQIVNGGAGMKNKTNLNLIKVSPNPLNTKCKITINSTNYKVLKIIISNSRGITKTYRNIDDSGIILHRSELRSGLYIIQLLENDKTIATKKLIVD